MQPMMPYDDTYLLTHTDPPTLAKVQRFLQAETPFYLFTFHVVRERSAGELPELRALLMQHISRSDDAVAEILRAVRNAEAHPAEDCTQELQRIRGACSGLLHQRLCDEELLWYELPDNRTPLLIAPVNLAPVLTDFAAELKRCTDGLFTVNLCSVPDALFSRTEPCRLRFILLSLFAEAQHGDPDFTGVSVSAVQAGTRIFLRLMLQKQAASAPDSFRTYADGDNTAAGERAIRSYFCRLFDARIIPQNTADESGFLVDLPAEKDVPARLSFHASADDEPLGYDSAFGIMLSRILNPGFLPPRG
jgi:hypothetical protein